MSPGAVEAPRRFGDRLIHRIRVLGHPLCVGIDPYLDRIPEIFRRGDMRPSAAATAEAVREFSCRVVDLVAERVAIVKPQIALFEPLGWRGIRALEQVVQQARSLGLLVLLDAKRGDIAETAAGYAGAYLGHDACMPVDAMTVAPYMGYDSIAPFVASAQATARGVVVVVRNSNPGSAAYQCLESRDGRLFEVVARSLTEAEACLRGDQTPWSSLGVTVGASSPDDSARVRDILARTLLLVLGYGAQGASAAAAVRGFVRGPRGLEGGIVSSSRPILFPSAGHADSASGWEAEVLEALRRATGELGEAVSG
jgi:orotidine-5'-phosphate decarboxylase